MGIWCSIWTSRDAGATNGRAACPAKKNKTMGFDVRGYAAIIVDRVLKSVLHPAVFIADVGAFLEKIHHQFIWIASMKTYEQTSGRCFVFSASPSGIHWVNQRRVASSVDDMIRRAANCFSRIHSYALIAMGLVQGRHIHGHA